MTKRIRNAAGMGIATPQGLPIHVSPHLPFEATKDSPTHKAGEMINCIRMGNKLVISPELAEALESMNQEPDQ